jgi:hypothetical protein
VLSGCGYPTLEGIKTTPLAGHQPMEWPSLELVSVVATKKTLFDHVATWVTGRDCSTPRSEREGTYCVDWPEAPPPPQQVYCYASWARPTCYAQPYTQGNDRLIGFVPASLPQR